MFFPSTSTWKMVKEPPSHIPDNLIGQAQTPREIHKDSYIIISPASFNSSDPVQYVTVSKFGIILSAFCAEVIIICICSAHSVIERDTPPPPHDQRYMKIIRLSYRQNYITILMLKSYNGQDPSTKCVTYSNYLGRSPCEENGFVMKTLRAQPI